MMHAGGYDCDIADFGQTTDFSGVWLAVMDDILDGKTNYGSGGTTMTLQTAIGYGWKNTSSAGEAMRGDGSTGSRTTTWNYMWKSILRTMGSRNGNGYGGTSGFGCFTGGVWSGDPQGIYSGSITGKRIITLGRDTNSSTTKSDYIDLSIYRLAMDNSSCLYNDYPN